MLRVSRKERYSQTEIDYLLYSIALPNLRTTCFWCLHKQFLDRCYKLRFISTQLNIRSLLQKQDKVIFEKVKQLAKKIWEIVETGHLRRLDHVDPKQDAINLFVGVWGAGPTTAEAWVSQGLKTLEDLKNHGKLTRQQEIGLKYYDEFLERMPREEAGQIEEVVKNAALEINPGLEAFACGSYRRGKPTCGDVDVIVSHPDGKSHEGVMTKLLDSLKSSGFLTDDLTFAENGEHRKYLGVCKLPGENTKHRRLDIIVVPYNEWACSLLYFTGSDYFNRSMRLLAKNNGMSLSEHSLNTGVVRKGGEKIFEGTPLPVFSEKDVFDYLGLEYREPHERDW